MDEDGDGVRGWWQVRRAGVQISLVRCEIFFIHILTFQPEFAPSDAKRLDLVSSQVSVVGPSSSLRKNLWDLACK